MPLIGLFIDPVYIVLLVVTLAISGASQLYIRSTFTKWRAVQNGARLSGLEIGQRLVQRTSFGGTAGPVSGISFKMVPGELSDHFDPRTKEVGLSQHVAAEASVAAMAVTAHEVGHAQQHAEGSIAMTARQVLVPALTFSPMLSYGLILIGLILNRTSLFWLGILVFAVMVVFSLLTLPVEIGASRRALVMLRDAGMLSAPTDASGARRVLIAAALTYVAAAVTSILTLLYYVSIVRR